MNRKLNEAAPKKAYHVLYITIGICMGFHWQPTKLLIFLVSYRLVNRQLLNDGIKWVAVPKDMFSTVKR